MDVSLIIVNYNVKEYIISCVDSIYEHSKSKYKFEIIIIDNNSKDGSVKAIKKRFPKILLIENNYNSGFAKAVNLGVKKSKGEFLFIINPDMLFLEDSIKSLLYYAKKINERRLGVIGPILISENYKKHQSYWRKPTLLNTVLSVLYLDSLNFHKNYKNTKINKIIEVDTISGGAFFLQKKIFDGLNGFNENLFWMEDIDFCIRAKKINLKNFYVPKTRIVHYIGKSAETNFKIAISNQLLSKIKFFRIHNSAASSSVLTIIIFIISIIKIIILAIFIFRYKMKIAGYFAVVRSILSHKND